VSKAAAEAFSAKALGLITVLVAALSVPALWVKAAGDIPLFHGERVTGTPLWRFAEGTDYGQYVTAVAVQLIATTVLIALASLGWMSFHRESWVAAHKSAAVAVSSLVAVALIPISYILVSIPLVPIGFIVALILPSTFVWAFTPAPKRMRGAGWPD
jgi:hypothetical protein